MEGFLAWYQNYLAVVIVVIMFVEDKMNDAVIEIRQRYGVFS